jgi:hypothetical protein
MLSLAYFFLFFRGGEGSSSLADLPFARDDRVVLRQPRRRSKGAPDLCSSS